MIPGLSRALAASALLLLLSPQPALADVELVWTAQGAGLAPGAGRARVASSS